MYIVYNRDIMYELCIYLNMLTSLFYVDIYMHTASI